MANSDHVLLLPYPSQGHINPMLQLGKRFAARGLVSTLAATRFILRTTRPEPGTVRLAAISDGFDQAGYTEAGSIPAYLNRLEQAGSRTLDDLLRAEAAAGRPVRLLVFDAFLPWAGDVGRRHGLATASFLTQSAAVNLIYCHVNAGRIELPVRAALELPGLPRLEPRDLPSFLPDLISVYPAYLELVLNQFKNLEKVDEVLINTVHELEPEEMDYLKRACGAKSVGPTIPSLYLDNRLPSDSDYGFHLFAPDVAPCMAWLDSKPPASVVYISFGSMSALSPEQMSELAFGLANTGKPFLWVVRSPEASKLPQGFAEEYGAERGLIVAWSPQLEVLAHAAVGCFVTHCGWNSTVEGLSLGMPLVGVPQWTDQPTNAKYVEDVWEVGVRVRTEEGGMVRREEIERCVREVMEGGRSGEMRRNAVKWRELAKAAVEEKGSSEENITGLIAKYCNQRAE
ncbi:crocetin glucosyltransferase 2-like [Canna indica]|uniref:Glycosyltransferase n=1 Tax=Canna indica TaxID=4628 RepID=A0AAQ3Q3I5_9LILI|nr:crocetin glucosyltransferase 2-like [Canna indica]